MISCLLHCMIFSGHICLYVPFWPNNYIHCFFVLVRNLQKEAKSGRLVLGSIFVRFYFALQFGTISCASHCGISGDSRHAILAIVRFTIRDSVLLSLELIVLIICVVGQS